MWVSIQQSNPDAATFTSDAPDDRYDGALTGESCEEADEAAAAAPPEEAAAAAEEAEAEAWLAAAPTFLSSPSSSLVRSSSSARYGSSSSADIVSCPCCALLGRWIVGRLSCWLAPERLCPSATDQPPAAACCCGTVIGRN